MASANNGDDLRGKTQQSPLASQRAKEQGTQPKGGYFPLGTKEGFSQWVRFVSRVPASPETNVILVG